jgi:hypothetical protein
LDAVKYNDDASLIFGHASNQAGYSFLFSAGYDGNKRDFREYSYKGNFKIMHGAL